MTITEIIDQAAEKYGDTHQRSTTSYYNTEQDLVNAFAAGVEWATTDPEMMKAMLQPFAEWCDNEYFTIQNPSMAVTKYIQFITDKPKEDAGR